MRPSGASNSSVGLLYVYFLVAVAGRRCTYSNPVYYTFSLSAHSAFGPCFTPFTHRGARVYTMQKPRPDYLACFFAPRVSQAERYVKEARYDLASRVPRMGNHVCIWSAPGVAKHETWRPGLTNTPAGEIT